MRRVGLNRGMDPRGKGGDCASSELAEVSRYKWGSRGRDCEILRVGSGGGLSRWTKPSPKS
jgi:hypothetical protein